MSDEFKDYQHAPTHLWVAGATYFLTGATLHHERLLNTHEKKHIWIAVFLHLLEAVNWRATAWVLLDNHYHAMLIAGEDERIDVAELVRRLHRQTAFAINRIDGSTGRQVWYNYWDRCITFETSYWPRINYIHHNPVKHGYVQAAQEYPYGSYHRSGNLWRDVESSHPWDAIAENDAF